MKRLLHSKRFWAVADPGITALIAAVVAWAIISWRFPHERNALLYAVGAGVASVVLSVTRTLVSRHKAAKRSRGEGAAS